MNELFVKLARQKRNLKRRALRWIDIIGNTEYEWEFVYAQNGYHNPNYSFTTQQIALVHLPKTGGTSLAKTLQNDPDNRFVNLKVHRPISPDCPPDEYKYLTVMREPVARVWSQFQMALRSPKGYPSRKYAHKGLNVYLNNCWFVRDMACRYFTGNIKKAPTTDTAYKAMDNLNKFYAVLDFDHFANELTLFLDQKNIPAVEIPHERKSRYNTPSAEEIAMIESYNPSDLLLYNLWKKSKSNQP